MDNKKIIEDRIEQALGSMDNHTPASPAPFLMTRINAAISARKMLTKWDKVYAIISRPTIAFAGIVLVLILNILILTSNRNSDSIKFQAEAANDWQGYPTATNSLLYDVENNIEP